MCLIYFLFWPVASYLSWLEGGRAFLTSIPWLVSPTEDGETRAPGVGWQSCWEGQVQYWWEKFTSRPRLWPHPKLPWMQTYLIANGSLSAVPRYHGYFVTDKPYPGPHPNRPWMPTYQHANSNFAEVTHCHSYFCLFFFHPWQITYSVQKLGTSCTSPVRRRRLHHPKSLPSIQMKKTGWGAVFVCVFEFSLVPSGVHLSLCSLSFSLRLFDHYMFMYQHLHSHSWPTKILYHVGPKEALLGWVSISLGLTWCKE